MIYSLTQAFLGVNDFLLSDEYSWSDINKCPGSSKLYNGSQWVSPLLSPLCIICHPLEHHSLMNVWQLAKARDYGLESFKNWYFS